VQRWLLALSLSFALAQSAAADSAPPALADAAAALLAVTDSNPLELARVAHRVGDEAVLALLEPTRPADVRLLAARTSPWLDEPERALVLLAELAASRDSDLAPTATRAALQIARGLDAPTLERREIAPSELLPARAALRAAAERSWVRPDLRLLAVAAAAQLEAAGVVPPDGK